MKTDEEILYKATLLLEKVSKKRGFGQGKPPKGEWYKKQDIYLEENERELLTEITEEEKQVVRDVLKRIKENPSGVLAFDDIFGDKLRLVVNFPVKSTESELGQFVDQLEQKLKLKVDWDKGMVSAEREWKDHVGEIDAMVNMVTGGGDGPKKIKKKFQMKIGKYFVKLDDLVKKWKETKQKIGDHKYGDVKWDSPMHAAAGAARWMLDFTGHEVDAALNNQELKQYSQLRNQLELYLGTEVDGDVLSYIMKPREQRKWEVKEKGRRYLQDKGDIDHGKTPRERKPIVVPETKFVDMGSYWLNNAKFVKDKVSTLEDDQYSMIISRHPIDILRMSDFEKIRSCHTPVSAGGEYPQYFKCAGAEAQGHGAISFVVDTEDLLSATNTSNIDSAQQELEEYDEIFQDQKRKFGIGENLGLEDPISRVRLRQFRYFRDFDGKDEPYGTELAVPEKVIYGDKEIAGIADRVRRWVRQKQETVLSKMPTKDGKINLDNFRIYGGSYEDTVGPEGRKLLLSLLTELPEDDFTGKVEQNTETEDELPDIVPNIESAQSQIDETAAKWNRDYAACYVKGTVRQDMGGAALVVDLVQDPNRGENIRAAPSIRFQWGLNEWSKLPNPVDMDGCIRYLLDGYGNIPDLGLQEIINAAKEAGRYSRWDPKYQQVYSNSYLDSHGFISKVRTDSGDIVEAYIEIDPELLIGWKSAVSGFYLDDDEASEYGFERFCEIIDLVDDERDNIQEGIEKYFKYEGYIDGGAYIKLAQEIENSELDSYYWDVEYDGEHFEESYEAWTSVKYDFDPEELNIEPRILFEILDSHDFRSALIEQLQDAAIIKIDGHPPKAEENELGYLMVRDSSAVENGGDIRYSITFKVEADDGDKLVALFRELVEGEMDDEDKIREAFAKALEQTAHSAGVKFNVNQSSEKVRNWGALKDLGEIWRRYL